MTPKEQTRLQVLNSLLAEQIALDQAAELMGVSPRHTRRTLAAYRENGPAAVAHDHRGRKPANATSEAVIADVVHLARTRYAGANHTHLTELLRDREGIDLSRPTVRHILTKAGIPSPSKRRPPKHRVRRQRMPQEGMLVQIDGSQHRWLSEDGPQFTLLLAVDDATSAVVNAVFRPEEDTRGYFILMQGLIERWGLPLALYGDRHGVFKFSGKPRHIQPPVEATHFSRALVELGIQQIFARSPQAKGRVERAAGTFQDRLVTELRLASASTIDQANAVLRDFLPRYNTRVAVPADLPEPAYRPWDGNRPLDEILCLKHGRKVARDNTVKYGCRTLQLLPSRERPSYAGVQVEVLEHTDDRLQVRHEGEIIPCRPAPPRPGALRASHGALAPNPEIGRIVKRLGNHRVSQPQLRHLANLEPDPVVEEPTSITITVNLRPAENSPRDSWPSGRRCSRPGPRACPCREISRQLRVHRNTVRKCARSLTQPTNRPINHGASGSFQPAINRSD